MTTGGAFRSPMPDQGRINAAIAALESQRPLLGNDVVDASIAALNEQLRIAKSSWPWQSTGS